MSIKKDYLIALIFAVILIGVVIAIGFFTLFQKGPTAERTPNPTLIPQSNRSNTQPVRSSETKTNPPIQYAPAATKIMLDKLKAKTPLSSADSLAKSKIISLLPVGQVSGVVYKSSTVILDYTKSADEFQGEILTVDIAQAKADAITWLKSQGLSQKAICDLPVVFYLNRVPAGILRDSKIQFNPLDENCT